MGLIRRKNQGDAWETVVDAGGGLPDPIVDPVTIEAPLTDYGLTIKATADPDDTQGVFRIVANDGSTRLLDFDSNAAVEINGTLDPGSGLKLIGAGVGVGADNNQFFRCVSPGLGNPLSVTNEGTVEVGYGPGLKIVGPHAAPIDDSLNPGEIRLWFDQTNGAAKLMLKAKTADGTVVTGNVALA